MFLKAFLLNNKLIGHLMFLVLFVLALLFYLERTIFVDPCYALFNLFYYRDYVVEASRHAVVIPQTLALLAIKMNLPFRFILAVYSVSFILLYYIVFLVIAYLFKLDRLALAVPLLLMVGVKYSFFWISTETHQALVYTILFYAFLVWSLTFRPGIFSWFTRVAVAAAILLLCFYSHPVSLFTVLFVLGFFVVDNKLWLKPEAYILAAVIIVLSLIKFLTSSPAGYENAFFKGFGSFFERLGDLLKSGSFIFLRKKLLHIYLFPMIIFMITTAWYLVKKQYLKLGYYLLSLLLFALIIFTTFDLWYYDFIQEKNLMGLILFLLIPFLKDVVFPMGRTRLVVQGLLVVMFLFGTIHVIRASSFFRERLAYISNLISITRSMPEKKFLMAEEMIDRDKLNVYWSLGPETVMLSSLGGPDSTVCMYINDNYGKIAEGTSLNDTMTVIFVPWAKSLDLGRMNRRYFNLDHSVTRKLTEKDLIQGKKITIYSNKFEDPAFHNGNDSCTTDSSGNRFFVLKGEFSPGLFGKYSDIIHSSSVMVTARVRVYPFEKMNPKWLILAISREQNLVVYNYHRSEIPPDSLKPGQWTTLEASGIVSSTDPRDQLKIYLWNPEKKRVGMDDFEISCQVVIH
ncbi:MAG: hypothetical protein WCK34_04080 [Bacteroidota bacterium]